MTTKLEALQQRGVIVHAPEATVIGDEIVPERIEEGVELYPGVTLRGSATALGKGTVLGKAGGGFFENVCTGRNVTLYGGYFKDCALLDNVTLRGHAEVRGGTVLEEEAEGAHHVGLKMTVFLPWVVAGSLVNFCDALVAGGRSRKEHSEIGSAMALYNYTPWGDKHASLFGDVPEGVFLQREAIFIGGQTQIVSPVHVGYGAVIPAGASIRRDVPAGTISAEAPVVVSRPFDREELGITMPRIIAGLRYIANLRALMIWYEELRIPEADAHTALVYQHALAQFEAGINERIKRLRALLERIPDSLRRHELALEARSAALSFAQRHRRIDDHQLVLTQREAIEALLKDAPGWETPHCREVLRRLRLARERSSAQTSFVYFIRDELDPGLREQGRRALQSVVDDILARVGR